MVDKHFNSAILGTYWGTARHQALLLVRTALIYT